MSNLHITNFQRVVHVAIIKYKLLHPVVYVFNNLIRSSIMRFIIEEVGSSCNYYEVTWKFMMLFQHFIV